MSCVRVAAGTDGAPVEVASLLGVRAVAMNFGDVSVHLVSKMTHVSARRHIHHRYDLNTTSDHSHRYSRHEYHSNI